MVHKISKQVDLSDTAKELAIKYYNMVWKPNKGFFENLFTFATYASPFLGVGWLPFAATLFASHILGVEVSIFGRWIDERLGTSPGKTPTMADLDKLPEILEAAVIEKQARMSHSLSKRAGLFSAIFSSIFKSRTIIKSIVSGIKKLFIALVGILSISHLSDLGKEHLAPIREKIEKMRGIEEPGKPEEKPEATRKEKLEKELEKLEKKYRGEK